jgi:hypothetical protein
MEYPWVTDPIDMRYMTSLTTLNASLSFFQAFFPENISYLDMSYSTGGTEVKNMDKLTSLNTINLNTSYVVNEFLKQLPSSITHVYMIDCKRFALSPENQHLSGKITW